MKKLLAKTLVVGLMTCMIAETSKAAPLNSRPVAVAGSSLQTALNNLTVAGTPSINVATDQDPFARFTSTASGGSVATFAIEIASHAGSNTFGIYDTTTGAKAQIFGGPAGPGNQALISFMADGSIRVNFQEVASAGSFITPGNFGFYMDVVGTGSPYTVYSEDDLNGGNAQALIFQGNNSTKLGLPGLSPGTFTDDEFIIAFEETLLAAGGGPGDYSDLVVLVESIAPIPAPGAFLLGGLGIGLVSLVRRRLR